MARLILARCPNCGANLQLDPEREVATCSHCNASSFVQTSTRRATIELLQQRAFVIDVKPKASAAMWVALASVPVILAGMVALGVALSDVRPSVKPRTAIETAHEHSWTPQPAIAPSAEPPRTVVPEPEPTVRAALTQKPSTSTNTRAPNGTVRMGATTVSGRLPPEVIQRIVRQNHGRFRMCYQQGLARSPTLEGRLSVRFVIGRDGNISNINHGDSSLADAAVVSCVLSAFAGLSFPQPEAGIVTVVYPLMFSPAAG
jgi:hypothetical protein